MLIFSRSGKFLRKESLSFVIFTKCKELVRAIRAIKYKKYVAGKYTRAHSPLGGHKSNIRVKRWHNKYENIIVN